MRTTSSELRIPTISDCGFTPQFLDQCRNPAVLQSARSKASKCMPIMVRPARRPSGDRVVLWAQSRAPHIGFVYPAGGRQGDTFQIEIGGQYLDGVTGAYVSGGGVSELP